ncbi:MAG: TIGR02281 family clan AA aspartic protease [Alphaproteobacteria bacterium CG11_big_fil_rev_8_21_14_0_20_44_7]|nr:MAG: TIGR02281 family clan AA aspartic protease [Alphaproteobacteria bacterium CG11_big_fil_rev_8_21_14_0_20_44_7]
METGQGIYYVMLIVLVGSAVIAHASRDWGKAGKMAAAWLVIIAVISVAATYWEDFANSKFASALIPGNAQIGEDGSLTFIRAKDGHFHINAEVNGKKIRFMVDTGASDIVLNQEDAEEIGIDLQNMRYDRIASTANGTTRGASIRLRNIRVGNLEFADIPASVNEGELDTSLLGMRFLDMLRSYQVEGNRLILNP